MKIRDSVMRFAEQMEIKLQENDHKGGWQQCEDDYLIGRLQQETYELYLAMNHKEPLEVRREAADVANFAMMIADIAWKVKK